MGKKAKEINELLISKSNAIQALNSHTRWVIERYEKLNDGLMNRAGTLAGFAGVELGLISQVVIQFLNGTANKPISHSYKAHLFIIFALAITSVLISIFSFLRCLAATKSNSYPDMVSLVQFGDFIEKSHSDQNNELDKYQTWIFDHLQNKGDQQNSIGQSFLAENGTRGKWFQRGVVALVVTQNAIATLVIYLFWRKN